MRYMDPMDFKFVHMLGWCHIMTPVISCLFFFSRADIFNSAGAFAQYSGLASDAFATRWKFSVKFHTCIFFEQDGFWKTHIS